VILSRPGLRAFGAGRPGPGFMGAVPESQVKQFIDRLSAAAGNPEAEAIEAALGEAQAALAAGDVELAAQGFSAILSHDPSHTKALAGMAACLLEAGQVADVKELLAGLTDEQRKDADIVSVEARIAQAEEVARLGDPRALQERLAADPDDHAARADLAKILNVKGERQAAADELLTIMRKDRSWDDDGARRILLSFFEAWGPGDPATLTARRKLSSILFS
ncbi:MAG: tetratricopeptide repeat protein, partial [Pararhizobium sp.]